MKIIPAILLLFLLVLSSMGLAQCWSNGGYSTDDPSHPKYGTHDWIAQHALDWLPTQEKQYITDNLAAFLYGTELPDNSNASAPGHIGDTAKHHIYYWANGTLQDDAAAVRASTEYQTALNFLNTGDYADAAETAGIMSHYIVDVAVFAHVMGTSTDWGAETGNVHSNYESYVETRTSSYIDTYNQYLSFDGNLQTISAYDAAKDLALDTTFDHGGTFTCVWMNNNYNISNPIYWDRAGESLNLAVNALTDALHTLYISSNPQPTPTPGPTQVNGIISSDTTWTQIGSPYNLAGNVLINNGVTLTIQPGVTVDLNNYYIMVNGTLYACSNSGNLITFNGGQITFTQYSTNWNESTGTGCIIENAIINQTSISSSNSLKISNNFVNAGISVGSSSIISNNTITGGIGVSEGGMPTISNNTILGQGISLFLANATVSGNTISGCSAGITAYTDFWDNSHPDAWYNCTSLIEGNLIVNNTYGIEIREQQGSKPDSPMVQNNTITDNTIGVYITWIGLGAPQPAILNNNIYNNSNYNIELNIPTNVNATYNWWGTNDSNAISQSIYDFKNDFNLGTVSFVPFLTAPNPSAPTIPAFNISASAGANGAISPSGNVSVYYGGSQSFNITANAGYHIIDVAVDDASQGAVSSYTFTNVQAAHTITASFAINTYSLTVNVGAHGSSNIASGTVNWGSVENFVFTPNAGYRVADVMVNGTIDEGAVTSLSITVTGSTTVSVSFAINTYTITVIQTANGNINPGTTTVNYGDSPAFTVTPNSAYYIASITTDGGAVTVASPSGQTVSFSNVQAAHTLTATYAQTATPTPTPTPVPTTAPTSAPNPTSAPTSASASTPTPTASSSPNTTPSPTPTVPEFPSAIIAIASLMAITTAALFYTKKPKNNHTKTETE